MKNKALYTFFILSSLGLIQTKTNTMIQIEKKQNQFDAYNNYKERLDTKSLEAFKQILQEKKEKLNTESDWTQKTILHKAVKDNALIAVKKIIEIDNINLNVPDKKNKNTALHIATNKGYYDITTLLIKKGACLYAKNTNGDIPVCYTFLGLLNKENQDNKYNILKLFRDKMGVETLKKILEDKIEPYRQLFKSYGRISAYINALKILLWD